MTLMRLTEKVESYNPSNPDGESVVQSLNIIISNLVCRPRECQECIKLKVNYLIRVKQRSENYLEVSETH